MPQKRERAVVVAANDIVMQYHDRRVFARRGECHSVTAGKHALTELCHHIEIDRSEVRAVFEHVFAEPSYLFRDLYRFERCAVRKHRVGRADRFRAEIFERFGQHHRSERFATFEKLVSYLGNLAAFFESHRNEFFATEKKLRTQYGDFFTYKHRFEFRAIFEPTVLCDGRFSVHFGCHQAVASAEYFAFHSRDGAGHYYACE